MAGLLLAQAPAAGVRPGARHNASSQHVQAAQSSGRLPHLSRSRWLSARHLPPCTRHPPPAQCLFPPVILLLFEVNHFFLKALLWVPPTNPLNTYRLTIAFLFALPATKVRCAAGAAAAVACAPQRLCLAGLCALLFHHPHP